MTVYGLAVRERQKGNKGDRWCLSERARDLLARTAYPKRREDENSFTKRQDVYDDFSGTHGDWRELLPKDGAS